MEVQMHTRLLGINELADILGITAPAIHAHLARRNFDAVPPPIKLGRRLVWPEVVLKEWLDDKIASAQERIAMATDEPEPDRRPGRPRKTRTRMY
jgi:predicted DNA-binding transcriptional regulator AlpA